MDTQLRCNNLKCRRPLTDRAIVTTCSHIFCLECSASLSSPHPQAHSNHPSHTSHHSLSHDRRCPACETILNNPDDAVSTPLKPTEDYKTSVLSGLGPNVIMECAGRALAFWSYQMTQEVVYQEFLARSLGDKYGSLSSQMDSVIHEANNEIGNLREKMSAMQVEEATLRHKNHDLAEAYRDKARQQIATAEKYEKLKKSMSLDHTRNAASEMADEALLAAFSQERQDEAGVRNGDLSRDHRFPGVDRHGARQRVGSPAVAEGSGMVAPGMRGQAPPLYGDRRSTVEDLTTPTAHRHRLPYNPPSDAEPLNSSRRLRASNLNTSSRRTPLEDLRAQSLNIPNLHSTMTGGMKVGSSERPRLNTSRQGSIHGSVHSGGTFANSGVGRHGGAGVQRPGGAVGGAMGGGGRYF